ncbi:hypothetical protein E2562_035984 [Oryza meyeriana var. granulata]|uniref:Uncharacterized protein n=1 Tax=Oryza meyeriana var. granulata TaxID=110450 RepID=A0A6G1ET09_9ORYZ|nr:hypothetical protein E2562_035984 [Oryza meyeriana var. granulata]
MCRRREGEGALGARWPGREELIGGWKKQLSENLISADLHGALVTVAECKSASYQGVCGIMIQETAETFGIISEDNRFRAVPKAGSVFILQADSKQTVGRSR